MYSVAKILEMIANTGKTLGMIDREVPRLQRAHRTVNCSWEHKGKVMRHIMYATEGKRRDLVDGVMAEERFGHDSTALCRPIRLTGEIEARMPQSL